MGWNILKWYTDPEYEKCVWKVYVDENDMFSLKFIFSLKKNNDIMFVPD